MKDRTNARKIEHIEIINEDLGVDRRKFYFDDIALTHRARPEVNLSRVDTSTTFLGKYLEFPLLISCMTGGDHGVIRTINRRLAEAAQATGVAMGVGSQRVMFQQKGARASFALRKHAPDALMFGNLGAVQLNKGFGPRECREAVDVLEADGLYLHLNPLQEAVQPEGDTDFQGLVARIGEVNRKLGVPVVVKEVGSGVSTADARLLLKHGIRHIDVAGSGGTSWSRIEHHRSAATSTDGLGIAFQDWGIPTPDALVALSALKPRPHLVASGGIRSGIDMAKAMILGASLCGLAAPFLKPAMTSTLAVVTVIERLRREFLTAMFLLGCRTTRDLKDNRSLIHAWRNRA